MTYFVGLFITFILFTVVLELNRNKIPSTSIHSMYAVITIASLVWVVALPISILIGILYLIQLGIKKLVTKYKG